MPRDSPEADVEDSSAAAILDMYRQGWFPMAEGNVVEWVQPRRRAIIPIDDRFVQSRSLRARVRSGRFRIRADTAFGPVIRACAESAPGREETWLSPSIIGAFESLHRSGLAHSIEAWLPTRVGEVLVGGLYGLTLGSVFCGESMFSRPDLGGTDASKVCLVQLVYHLRACGFELLDAQIMNPHLVQFGAYEMPAAAYRKLLRIAAAKSVAWGSFGGAPGV